MADHRVSIGLDIGISIVPLPGVGANKWPKDHLLAVMLVDSLGSGWSSDRKRVTAVDALAELYAEPVGCRVTGRLSPSSRTKSPFELLLVNLDG